MLLCESIYTSEPRKAVEFVVIISLKNSNYIKYIFVGELFLLEWNVTKLVWHRVVSLNL